MKHGRAWSWVGGLLALALTLSCGEHRTQVGSAASRGQGGAGADGVVPGVGAPLLWLDATRLPTEREEIVRWPDSSLHHHDALQAVAAARPRLAPASSGGFPSVRFDGVDDYLTVPNQDGAFDTPELTVLLALAPQPNPSENNPSPFGIREEGATRISTHVDGNLADFHSYNGNTVAAFNVPLLAEANTVLTFRWSDGRVFLYRDGVLVSEQPQALGEAELSAVQIGNSHPGWERYAGTIGEILVFSWSLSDTEMVAVHEYTSRWLRDR